MKQKRILSYNLSQKITTPEIESISAASTRIIWCGQGSYEHGAWDMGIDMTNDY
ncbi:MAG: hypothetical protein V4501_05765 [Pseudomonadota bacterium]